MVDLDFILEDCLTRLAQGETLQACLERYPEQAAELQPLLAAAALLEAESHLNPSPAFKMRARAQLRDHMQAHPRQHSHLSPHLSPAFRFGLSAIAVLFAFSTMGMALAQFALPGDMLYSWKLASEQGWRAISPDPVGVDLSRGNRRIDEALALSDRSGAQSVALHGYQKVVVDLTQYHDMAVQDRIAEGLKIQQDRLKDAGLELPDSRGQDLDPSSVLPTAQTGDTPVSIPKITTKIPKPTVEIPAPSGP